LDERSMTNQTVYPLTKLTTLTLMTTINYYKDFRTTDQTQNSYSS